MKKVGVFAGGGSFGAYTVGVLAKNKPTYDITYGCSTGALIAPFAVLGKWDVLRENYTSITTKDIFTVNPFYKSGLPNPFVIIPRFIQGKMFGDTTALRNKIKEVFTKADFNEIKRLNKDVCIVVSSVTDKDNETKYVYLSKSTYEDFCFYMWASTCVPAFCSLAIDEIGYEYVDGGVTDVVPLAMAIIDGATEVDTYTYNEVIYNPKRNPTKNALHLLARIWNMMRKKIANYGFLVALIKEKEKEGSVIINKFNPPYKLADNSLVFDKTKMTEWFMLGYNPKN